MNKNNKCNIINQLGAKTFIDKREDYENEVSPRKQQFPESCGERPSWEIFRAWRVPGEFPKLSSWVPVESTIRLIMLSAHLSTQPFIIPPPVYQYIDPLLTCVKLEPVAATYLGTRGTWFSREPLSMMEERCSLAYWRNTWGTRRGP